MLFRGEMVRAILEGRKTQTRRPVKPAPADMVRFIGADNKPTWDFGWCSHERVISKHIPCPYGKPGDRLWVREGWRWYGRTTHGEPSGGFEYRADGCTKAFTAFPDPEQLWQDFLSAYQAGKANKNKPSIHMPRWACRLVLDITDVRVERLQDISREDAIAEGIQVLPLQSADDPSAWWQSAPGVNQERTPQASFASLWRSIHGRESWDANPWLWVISFKKAESAT
jgi:hypothetical protein